MSIRLAVVVTLELIVVVTLILGISYTPCCP